VSNLSKILRTIPPDAVVFYTTVATEIPQPLTLRPMVTKTQLIHRFRTRDPMIYPYAHPHERYIRFDLSLGMAIREALHLKRAYEKVRSSPVEMVIVAVPLSLILHAAEQYGFPRAILNDRPPEAKAVYVEARELTLGLPPARDIFFTEVRFTAELDSGDRIDYEATTQFIDSILQDESDASELITHTEEEFLDDTLWRQKYLDQIPEPFDDDDDIPEFL